MNSTRPSSFELGDIIVHSKFGRGRVAAIHRASTSSNAESDFPITAMFDASGEKRVMASFLRLESEVHRIDELSDAMKGYRDATIETYRLLTRLGRDLIVALGKHLHRRENFVIGVPPDGEWKPDEDYRDAALSTYHKNQITLEPIEVGIAIRIPVDEDALWIRIVVKMQKAGDTITLSLNDGFQEMTLPINYAPRLEEAAEFLFKHTLSKFEEDLKTSRGGFYGPKGKIGFHKS